MSEVPFFSIVSPVYNVEKYIRQSIESVIHQSFQNYELILVDDGSTDTSGKICDEYALKHPNIKVFHNSNHGLFYTRRFGVSKANGKWVVHLDSDDWLEENALETIYDTAEKTSADCVVYGLKRIVGGKTKEASNSADAPVMIIDDKRELSKLVFLNACFNAICRKASKREILGKMDLSGYYHISRGEDQIQTLELIKYANRTVVIPNLLYNYRYNPTSITGTLKYHPGIVSYEKEVLILDFLEKNGFFTPEDYEEFRCYMAYWLNINVIQVVLARIPLKDKISWLKEYSEAEFVRVFIAGKGFVGNRSRVETAISLLLEKHYYRLVLLCLIEKLSLLAGKELQ